MATKIYIGLNEADCSDEVNLVFSGGDIRNLSEGMVGSSYEISLPLTPTNKKLLKYSHELNCFEEVSDKGYVFKNGFLVLQGKIVVLSYLRDVSASILIQGTGWIDHFQDLPMKTLDFSAEDHEYNTANIEASWTGAEKFYRYPMIFFSKLFSGETGVDANWLPNDFIPMFRIVDILEKIFHPFTLAGGWLTEIAELYILGKEPQKEEAYLREKDFDVKVDLYTDNYISDTIGVGVTKDIVFPEITVDFNDVINNDQSGFQTISNRYKVIDAGTHYFSALIRPAWTATSKVAITINSQRLYIRIKRERGGVTTTLFTQQVDYVSTDILENITYTQVTGWMHFEADDYVWVTVQMYQNITNNGGTTQNVSMYLTSTTEFKLTWDKRCLCFGIGATVSAEEMMPDVSRLDFVKAVKEAFNLRFMPDLLNQKVYIESFDKAMSTNVVSIAKIDHFTLTTENISSNYNSTIKLKLKADTGDKAVSEYLKRNAEPYVKDVILSSLYTKKGIDTWENSLFAYTQSENLWFMSVPITNLRMWGSEEYPLGQYYPEYRTNRFLPRLLWWDGLTTEATWYYNGSAKTQHPKASSVDMTAVYSTNFLKTFHLIDRGKIVKFEMVADVTLMQQFITVVSNINEEGFRVMYELGFNGQKYYGYLNKIEFVGDKALMELIIKH